MMSPLAAVSVALTALRVNALRSFLAMLGVIIGVAAVIVMISVSQGARQGVQEQISALGANTLNLRPGSSFRGGARGGAGSARLLNEADAEALREQVPYIAAAAGFMEARGQSVVVDGQNWTTGMIGTHPDLFSIRGWDASEGRLFDLADTESGSRVAVIGQTVESELYPSGGAIGSTIRVGGVQMEVVGVLAEIGQSSWGQDQDDVVITPLGVLRDRVLGESWPGVRDPVHQITVQIDRAENMQAATWEIEDLMRLRRDIRPGGEDDFRVFNFAEFVEARNETERQLGLLLSVTAAIALVVGGIGIMNIMLVSVTERTREIGLRLAIGARRADVRNQFLIEAVVLCLAGGLIGLGLGVSAAMWVASMDQFRVAVEPFVALVAIGAATGVGVLFGFYPAHRASRLNPIDALRYE